MPEPVKIHEFPCRQCEKCGRGFDMIVMWLLENGMAIGEEVLVFIRVTGPEVLIISLAWSFSQGGSLFVPA